MGYLIHVLPDSLENKSKAFIGSTKDIGGRLDYFATRGFSVRSFLCQGRSDVEALKMLKAASLANVDAVFFEYETYAESLSFLKEHYPKILRIVRSHNANLPHFVDQFRGSLRMLQNGLHDRELRPLEFLKTALHRFSLDNRCAEASNFILPICEWEAQYYWGSIAQKTKIVNVPYFLPGSFAKQVNPKEKTNKLVCLLGMNKKMTPLLFDVAQNTIEVINALPDYIAKKWAFYVTGSLEPQKILHPLGRVKAAGRLNSPLDFIADARVVTVLSDLGMGFKTKILEAIQSSCWVIVTKDLLDRLPKAVQPWCIAIDGKSVTEFAWALEKTLDPVPNTSPNQQLRAEAFQNLDCVLGRTVMA